MTNGNESAFGRSSLTKREIFAAMAMQGIVANASVTEIDGPVMMRTVDVADAVALADALIEALNKTEEM